MRLRHCFDAPMSLDAWNTERDTGVVKTSTRESRENPVVVLPTAWAAVRDELRSRRRVRTARRKLRRDLASYTTTSDIDDLDATLDRFDDDDVAEIRSILRQNRITAA